MCSSLTQVENMLAELSADANVAGLQLHLSKTNILSNRRIIVGLNAKTCVSTDGYSIDILSIFGQTKYLDRCLRFKDYHGIELDH